MSLSVLAARFCAVEALKGRTLVGANVLDSEIAALDADSDGILRVGKEKRFIAVYTQGGTVSNVDNAPRPLLDGGTCEMTFEVGVTAAMGARDDETGESFVFEGIPVTDAAFEFYLDVVGRQILDCLADPENVWAEMWRDLCPRVIKIERARASSSEMTRLAGHQIKMICEVVDQPLIGGELDAAGGFAKFLTAIEADAPDGALPDEIKATSERNAMAVVLRSILAGDPPSDWQYASSIMGLSTSECDALGVSPLKTDTGEVGTSSELTIDVDGLAPNIVESDA